MPGRWTVTRTQEGSQQLDYFDFLTRRSFRSGTVPCTISERDVLLWILEKSVFGDVIVGGGPSLDGVPAVRRDAHRALASRATEGSGQRSSASDRHTRT